MSKELAQEIAQALDEPNVGQVYKVVHVIGADRTRAFLQQTLEIEASGGMLIATGQRRRTPGGVFFYLVRSSVSTEERRAILLKPTEKKPERPAQPSTAPPPTWGEGQSYIRKLLEYPRGEVSAVKLTLIGRPKKITQVQRSMLCVMEGKSIPPDLPQGLPTPPDAQVHIAVFIAEKHWQNVAHSLKENKDDELIIEGYPVFDSAKNVTAVLAQSVTTKLLQRERQGTQREEE